MNYESDANLHNISITCKQNATKKCEKILRPFFHHLPFSFDNFAQKTEEMHCQIHQIEYNYGHNIEKTVYFEQKI